VRGAEVHVYREPGDRSYWPELVIGVRDAGRLEFEGKWHRSLLSARPGERPPSWEDYLYFRYDSAWQWDPAEVSRYIDERATDRRPVVQRPGRSPLS